MEFFAQLGVILVTVTVVSLFMKALRQPFIVGYILAGIIVGPYILNVVHDPASLELFSKLGISILLFIVGLNLSPSMVREVGRVAVVTASGQIAITSILGYAIAILLKFPPVHAFYIAIGLTLSSTIIVLKILSDKQDLTRLYGRIAIGFLLVQDLVATIVLLGVTTVSGSGTNVLLDASTLFVKAILVVILLFVISKYVVSKASNFLSGSQELLFLFAITWGIGLAAIFHKIGLSLEIGALLAGVSLSIAPFSFEVSARMKPLRDFFVVTFFVFLGSQMSFVGLGEIIPGILIFSLYVLIGNPIIMMVIMGLLGFKHRTSFQTGLIVAQISEFSLILAALGKSLGHIDEKTLSLITIVGLITIAGSSYLIHYSDQLYKHLAPYLKKIKFRKHIVPENDETKDEFETLLCGYDRVGKEFIDAFEKADLKCLVVDVNPQSISKLKKDGISGRLGDIEDPEFLDELPLSKLKIVVSTVPDLDANLVLATHIRKKFKDVTIVVFSHSVSGAHELYEAGATLVVIPHYLGAQHVATIIKTHGSSPRHFEVERDRHMKNIMRNFK